MGATLINCSDHSGILASSLGLSASIMSPSRTSPMKMSSSAQRRWQDTVMFVYFVLQIPSTLIFDTQGVYPESLYPAPLRWLYGAYIGHYKDPFLANAWNHPWYLSICLVEHFIEVPFFFWAAWAYYRGAKTNPQILLPALMYSIHTITIVVAVWFMAFLQDFSSYTTLAPSTLGERITLCTAYFPFIATSIFCVWDTVTLCKDKITFDLKTD